MFCQNIKADVAAINKAYKSMNKVSLSFELNMFENYQTQHVYYTQHALIQKNGNATFQKFDESECINTRDYSVMVDNEDKEVVYAPKKISFEYDDPSIAINLDTLLQFCKSYQFKKISKDVFSYSLMLPENYPNYNQIVFYFDAKTYFVQKIIFYCEEDDISVDNEAEKLAKSRIEINYKDINTRPTFNPNDFSYQKYLVKSGNTFKLKPELKNYHLTVLSF